MFANLSAVRQGNFTSPHIASTGISQRFVAEDFVVLRLIEGVDKLIKNVRRGWNLRLY